MLEAIIYILYGAFYFLVLPVIVLFLPSCLLLLLMRHIYRKKFNSVIFRSIPVYLVFSVAGYYCYTALALNYIFIKGVISLVIALIVTIFYFIFREVKFYENIVLSTRKYIMRLSLSGIMTLFLVLFIFTTFYPFSLGELDIPNRHDASSHVWKELEGFDTIDEVKAYLTNNYVKGNALIYNQKFELSNFEKGLTEIMFNGKTAYELSYDEGYLSMHMIFLNDGRIIQTVWINKSV